MYTILTFTAHRENIDIIYLASPSLFRTWYFVLRSTTFYLDVSVKLTVSSNTVFLNDTLKKILVFV